jgi:nucleotide-binding universal stress UspA family protein
MGLFMERMKILIGYDGSQGAESALADLQRAGLPPDTEVLVISVAEEWIPTPIRKDEKEVAAQANYAKSLIKTIFPKWQVHAEAASGSPANILIQKAEEWNPEMIVVGSQGRTALGRFFFGSVSQKVLHEASCSVRIARGGKKGADEPVRIIAGVDGSKGAESAVAAISTRCWPRGTEARVVVAINIMPRISSELVASELKEWIASENARVKDDVDSALNKFRGIGLNVSAVVKEADAKQLLCAEAYDWGADCIFVGARGMGTIERMLMGSVSSSVASRAHCSVEVIRLK